MTYLCPAMLCQLHTVIRNELVNVAVLVPLRLRMANQYNHLRMSARPHLHHPSSAPLTRGFPMLAISRADEPVLEGICENTRVECVCQVSKSQTKTSGARQV